MKESQTRWICVGLLAASPMAWADYRGEVGVEYKRGSLESGYSIPEYEPPAGDPPPTGSEPPTMSPSTGSDEDYDGWELNGQWYFEEVDTSRGPLRLAPFLSRASGVGGSIGRYETDDTDIETEYWEAMLRVVLTRWSLEAGVGASEIDGVSDTDIDVGHLAVGYYVLDNTELKLSVDREDGDIEEYDRWSVQVEHVQSLENGVTWHARGLLGLVKGDHELLRDTDGTDWEASVGVFFNHQFGVGFDYQMQDRDDAGELDYHKLWASYFPTEKVVLELSYYGEENDDLDIESDGVLFTARYRF